MAAVRARGTCPARFPYLPEQSGYNKRLRAAVPLIKRVIRVLAADTDLWADPSGWSTPPRWSAARSRPTVQALGPGRVGRLRLLRLPLPVLLGPAAVPGLHPGRAADHLGAGQPEDRRTEVLTAMLGPRPGPDRRPARAGDHRRQGLRLRRARRRTSPTAASTLLRPSYRNREPHAPASTCSSRSASSSSRSTTPSKASSTWNSTAAAPSTASPPASPNASSP